MREIKFRAWDKELKMMIYRNETTGNIEFETNPVNAVNYILNYDDWGIEFMQYVGLKDKNKKEIYEGDILKDEENFLWKVVAIDGGWAIECINLIGMQCLTMTETRYFEIVGNIYENPELLEV